MSRKYSLHPAYGTMLMLSLGIGVVSIARGLREESLGAKAVVKTALGEVVDSDIVKLTDSEKRMLDCLDHEGVQLERILKMLDKKTARQQEYGLVPSPPHDFIELAKVLMLAFEDMTIQAYTEGKLESLGDAYQRALDDMMYQTKVVKISQSAAYEKLAGKEWENE